MQNPEYLRLEASKNGMPWKKFGPYLSERQWGTVREDYSEFGSAWEFFPHDHARSRAYRWGEDGIAGISDDKQRLCFALSLWNEKDPVLKERLFGLTGNEGNHSEDVKELYYYLDSTPTHSYMKYLYKYPQNEFPYAELVEKNAARSKQEKEYELADTGIFDKDEYFDIFTEYAKADEDDILIRVTINNKSAKPAKLHLLPTLWFRNTWAWGIDLPVPKLYAESSSIQTSHPDLGEYSFTWEGAPSLLFTDNETNATRLFGLYSRTEYVKDAFHEYLIDKRTKAVNPALTGTKAALHYALTIEGHGVETIKLRLKKSGWKTSVANGTGHDFNDIFSSRIDEANVFYHTLLPLQGEIKNIQRQAFAGLLWGKQYYNFNVKSWLYGDPGQFPPPDIRKKGRNREWLHIDNQDIISMPDKWEYPWYAAWDLAFHCIPLARVDAEFAKEQLSILVQDRYMNAMGQIPAYEWAFGDVNPPVHAYGAWKVYLTDKDQNKGKGDLGFLHEIYCKLQRNYYWWLHTKTVNNKFIFTGGFLGLDNVGVLDRGAPLPEGAWMEQLDATSWMALYSLNLMKMALELSELYPHYEQEALYFAKNFLKISADVNDPEFGFIHENETLFYEKNIRFPDGRCIRLDIRNIVSLMVLYPVENISAEIADKYTLFSKGLQAYINSNPVFFPYADFKPGGDIHFSMLPPEKLGGILDVLLNEKEFLSPFGIRSLSKYYELNPYTLDFNGKTHQLTYRPAESDTEDFGENSNWRGPVWFPVNYVLIDSLLKLGSYHGDTFTYNFTSVPTGKKMTLTEIAYEISGRLCHIFTLKKDALSLYNGQHKIFKNKDFGNLPLFFEYFDGDTGAGCGASHQTGWTGLIADLAFILHTQTKSS